jgi:hypothetical protein
MVSDTVVLSGRTAAEGRVPTNGDYLLRIVGTSAFRAPRYGGLGPPGFGGWGR